MKFRTLFSIFLFAGVVFAAALGQLDTPGVIISFLALVIGYLGYGFIAANEEGKTISTSDNQQKSGKKKYKEKLKNADTNIEILQTLKKMENDLFNNDVYISPQNTMWDSHPVSNGEGESKEYRTYLLTDKSTNQDILIEVNREKGEITRRGQRLETLELYNLFENSSTVEAEERNNFSSSSQVMNQLERYLNKQTGGNTQSSGGITVDNSAEENDTSSEDENQQKSGVLEKTFDKN